MQNSKWGLQKLEIKNSCKIAGDARLHANGMREQIFEISSYPIRRESSSMFWHPMSSDKKHRSVSRCSTQ